MVITQALLFQDGLRIVETADEQVESDKFVFHKLNLISSPLICFSTPDSHILYPGNAEWGMAGGQESQEPVKTIKLVVDFVRFTDGTTWGEDKYKHAEFLKGERAGVRAVTSRLFEIEKDKGLEGVLNAITNDGETVVPPDGHSPRWAEGFRRGLDSVKRRLNRAKESGGAPKVEEEFQQILTSLERTN